MLCLSCGDRHFATEKTCPRTGRNIDVGPVGSTIGPYRVGKLLGAGGFGSVYRAVDTRDQSRAALKLLHPDLVADPAILGRFIREADATARAGNPHIVRVFEASFTDGAVYVALELLDGEPLSAVMRGGALPVERAVDVCLQILAGLTVAHAAGVLHRDIKPANIFLADQPGAPRSHVKILDFGIGRLLEVNGEQRLTRTGMTLGTPHFMAPEQVTDSKRTDARADLYATAVTLYGMLASERPYGRIPANEWLVKVVRGEPAPRAFSPYGPLPEALVQVIATGLAIDPEHRYPDANSFRQALLAATRPALDDDATILSVDPPTGALPTTLAAPRASLPSVNVALSSLIAPAAEAPVAARPSTVAPADVRAPAPVVVSASPARRSEQRTLLLGAALGVFAMCLVGLGLGAGWLLGQRQPSTTTPTTAGAPVAPSIVAVSPTVTNAPPPTPTVPQGPESPAPLEPAPLAPEPRPSARIRREAPVAPPAQPTPAVEAAAVPPVAAPSPPDDGPLRCVAQYDYRICTEFRYPPAECPDGTRIAGPCPTISPYVRCRYSAAGQTHVYDRYPAALEARLRQICTGNGGVLLD